MKKFFILTFMIIACGGVHVQNVRMPNGKSAMEVKCKSWGDCFNPAADTCADLKEERPSNPKNNTTGYTGEYSILERDANKHSMIFKCIFE